MSWSLSLKQSVSKAEASAAIDALDFSENDVSGKPEEVVASMRKQLDAAKFAAKHMLAGIGGPKANVSLSGHANGVGDNPPPPSWSADSIYVSVSQATG